MKMKFKKTIFFIACLIIISCSKKQDEKEYYSSGNLKSLKVYNLENDKLEQTIYYYDLLSNKKMKMFYHKLSYDSIVYYYNNGKVFKTGKQDFKENLYGKWNYYTREGFLSDTKEYVILNNEFGKGGVLNQNWYYNQKGDTMYYGNNKFNIYNQKEFELGSKGTKTSRFTRFNFDPKGDTLSIANPFRAFAEDGFPVWGALNSEEYVVLAKEKFNFNKDFSNEAQIKLDTFFCLEKDKVNKNKFPKVDQKHAVAFGRWFDTPGKKILRGYMVEYYKNKPTTNDSIIKQERRTYFEKVIYVKDTVK